MRQRLLTIPGVSQVIAIGGGVKQYQVLASPEKMAAYNVTLKQVMEAAGKSQVNTPGGFLEGTNQEALIRNIGRTTNIEDIANSVVETRKGVPILLKDVAEVKFGKQVMRGDAGVNGQPAVIVSVQKQPGTDTVKLTATVEKALAEIQRALPADVKITPVFKQGTFIERRHLERGTRDPRWRHHGPDRPGAVPDEFSHDLHHAYGDSVVVRGCGARLQAGRHLDQHHDARRPRRRHR